MPRDTDYPVWLTDHAIEMYNRRTGKALQVKDVLQKGIFRLSRPSGTFSFTPNDGYLVYGDAVFPLKFRRKRFIAVTCVTRVRKASKAERRALREQAKELVA